MAVTQTSQGARLASVRAVTGTALTDDGDWHALFDAAGIASGTYDGRLLAWINLKLSTSYTNLPQAMQALADANGAYNFSSMGTFNASIGSPLSISGTPVTTGTQNSAYAGFSVSGAGGTAPYTYSVHAGTLPTGITLNSSTGAVSGTPTGSGSSTGIVLRVTDALSATADLASFDIAVTGVPVTNDPVAVTIIDNTSLASIGAGLINPNSWVAAVQFKGMATGQVGVASKFSFTVTEPGFDATGAAITVTRTVTGQAMLRKPFPTTITNGATVVLGQRCGSAAKVSGTSRIYQCTNAGGTAQTASFPVHTTGTVTGADGIAWLYVGGTGDSSTLWNTYKQPVETTTNAGADALVYVVLSSYIPSTATVTACTIQAGAYGSSNASRVGIVTFTNSSTLTALPVHTADVTPPWQIVTNDSLRAETAVFHPFGANSSPLAAFKFVIRNAAGTVVLTAPTLTQPTVSTYLTGGNTVQVFGQSIDTSSLTDQALYYLSHEAYPTRGAAYKSFTSGYGPTAPTSTTFQQTANVSKVIPFRLDRAGTFGKVYAYVDSVSGNDGTGQASATAATAAAAPFATINAAVRTATKGLQAVNNSGFSRNDCGNGEIRLVGSNGGAQRTFVGFHSSANSMSSATMGDVWLTITRDPATTTTAADVAITPAASAALKTSAKRVKYYDISLVGTAANAVIDNQIAGTVGDFTFEAWFDKCTMTSASAQRVVTRSGWNIVTNATCTNWGPSVGGDVRGCLKMMGGSTVSGTLANSGVCAVNCLGVTFTGGGGYAACASTFWAEGTGGQTDQQTAMWMFNRFPTCSATPKFVNSSTAHQFPVIGATWVMNEVESYNNGGSSSAKGGEIDADGINLAIDHIYYMWNTCVGDGINIAYNENGTAFVAKRALIGFNLLCDFNTKGDLYDSAPEAASANRVGNFSTRFLVDSPSNAVYAQTDLVGSPKNLSGELTPTTWASVQAVQGFINDQSFVPANIGGPSGGSGGGDYRPHGANIAKSMVGATAQMFLKDLGGATRAVDGTGCVGSREAA